MTTGLFGTVTCESNYAIPTQEERTVAIRGIPAQMGRPVNFTRLAQTQNEMLVLGFHRKEGATLNKELT